MAPSAVSHLILHLINVCILVQFFQFTFFLAGCSITGQLHSVSQGKMKAILKWMQENCAYWTDSLLYLSKPHPIYQLYYSYPRLFKMHGNTPVCGYINLVSLHLSIQGCPVLWILVHFLHGLQIYVYAYIASDDFNVTNLWFFLRLHQGTLIPIVTAFIIIRLHLSSLANTCMRGIPRKEMANAGFDSRDFIHVLTSRNRMHSVWLLENLLCAIQPMHLFLVQ